MSPRWRWWPPILVLLVVAACTSRTESGGETTATTTPTPGTSVESTGTSTVPQGGPGYLLYGPEGITRVEGGVSVRLVVEPVGKAADDLTGGVVFTYETENPPWVDRPVYWLPVGASEPVVVAKVSWFDSVALVDGRPSLVHTDEDARYGGVETGDLDTWHLLLTDLQSGHRRVLFHHSQWFEGGISGVTGGGGRFVGSQWDMMSVWRIVSFDLDGEELDLPAEVHADPGPSAGRGCWRVCELDALLSPDGRHLVTWFWPEAEAPRDDQLGWWEQARKTPAEIRITALDTGEVWFEREVPAETMLGDFDGRFLALREVTRVPQESVETESTLIVDTSAEWSDSRVAGQAVLVKTPVTATNRVSWMDAHWTVVLASVGVGAEPRDTSEAYETARSKEEGYRGELGLVTGVLLSDDYITLNPGYWVVRTGAYATREEAAARCEELRPLVGSCYPRYVATPRSLDPGVEQRAVGMWDEVSVSLQPGEYARVDVADAHGLLSGLQREDGTRIGVMDDPASFLLPEHGEADLLWFSGGTIVWRFPNPLPANALPRFLRFDVEVSSEAAQARASHPSEMTVTVNGVEVGRWVIPADPDASYGNPDDPQVARQRNHLDPWRSQFGWLTHWTVDSAGTWFGYDFRLGDAAPSRLSKVGVGDLRFTPGEPIEVAVTVEDATVDGITGFGLNVYGSTWGDYPIDPTVTAAYSLLPTMEWRRVDLPGVGSVSEVVAFRDGFYAIGRDPTGPVAWRSADGITWRRVEGLAATFGAACEPGSLFSTGEALLAMIRCPTAGQSGGLISRPWLSADGVSWSPGEGPLTSWELEPGAWWAPSIEHVAVHDDLVLLAVTGSVEFAFDVFLPRYVDADILAREHSLSFSHDTDEVTVIDIYSGSELIFSARLDDLGVSAQLLSAAGRPDRRLWRSGHDLTFEPLSSRAELGLEDALYGLCGTPTGFYAHTRSGIFHSDDGGRWSLLPAPPFEDPRDTSTVAAFGAGIVAGGPSVQGSAYPLAVYEPDRGWSTIPLPTSPVLNSGPRLLAVGSGLLAGWYVGYFPGAHQTQSSIVVDAGEVILVFNPVDALLAGDWLAQVRDKDTGKVLVEIVDPGDGSVPEGIIIEGDALRLVEPATGKVLGSVDQDRLIDEACITDPELHWWYMTADRPGQWAAQPDVVNSQPLAFNRGTAVFTVKEDPGALCPPIGLLFGTNDSAPPPQELPQLWVGDTP